MDFFSITLGLDAESIGLLLSVELGQEGVSGHHPAPGYSSYDADQQDDQILAQYEPRQMASVHRPAIARHARVSTRGLAFSWGSVICICVELALPHVKNFQTQAGSDNTVFNKE